MKAGYYQFSAGIGSNEKIGAWFMINSREKVYARYWNFIFDLLVFKLSARDGATATVSYMVHLKQFDMVFIEKIHYLADSSGDKHFFEGRWIP